MGTGIEALGIIGILDLGSVCIMVTKLRAWNRATGFFSVVLVSLLRPAKPVWFVYPGYGVSGLCTLDMVSQILLG